MLACALGHRVGRRFPGGIHWFRVGAWDARTIGEMLRQSSGKGRPLKDHLSGLIRQRRDEGSPLSDECVDALQRLLSNSENTLSSVVATFNAPLTILADAVVDAATSADDFRLEDVRRRRMSIYVRIPPNRLANFLRQSCNAPVAAISPTPHRQ